MKNHVYKILEIVGSSQTGIDDAINTAVELAGKTIRNMDWFEVVETRGHIKNGKIAHYQVTQNRLYTGDAIATDTTM